MIRIENLYSRQVFFKVTCLMFGITICGIYFLLPLSWGQPTIDPADQIQKLSLESQKLMDEYSKKKQEIENSLSQK